MKTPVLFAFRKEKFMEESKSPPESPEKCKGCPYPAHGFVCWRQDGDCLRETVRKIFGIEKEEESND